MASFDDAEVARIVAEVLARVRGGVASVEGPPEAGLCAPPPPRYGGGPALHTRPRRAGVYPDVDTAVAAAHRAFTALERTPLEVRAKMLENLRRAAAAEVDRISEQAVAETGLGRAHHKRKKNRLVIEKTPGMEILRPVAVSGDRGLTLTERAPYGVIGAITPTTNPTETVICNAIGMLAGGNAVVFNVHPGAREVSSHLIDVLNRAMHAAGGPEDCIASVEAPTIESAQALMHHPGVRLLVVTGGPGVVKAAMASGKRAIAAGPGNPPVVVDETADLTRAAKGIVAGGSLDNCIVCTAEKEVIAVAEVADALKRLLAEHGAYEARGAEARRLRDLVIDGAGPNRAWVGKDASKILEAIGVRRSAEIIIVEEEESGPFMQLELLMPVLGFTRARSAEDAIQMARRVEHGFGHTAAMYSNHVGRLHDMARAINTSIFTKNAPTFAGLGLGGEGYTSFTIASPTGEGLTHAGHFTRERRCTLVDAFRIV